MLKYIVAAAMLLVGTNAQAETLRIETIYPAESDEAAAMRTIAIDRFTGREGRDFANRIEDRLVDAAIDGQPLFTLIHRAQAENADAILDGEAWVRVTESSFPSGARFAWKKTRMGNASAAKRWTSRACGWLSTCGHAPI